MTTNLNKNCVPNFTSNPLANANNFGRSCCKHWAICVGQSLNDDFNKSSKFFQKLFLIFVSWCSISSLVWIFAKHFWREIIWIRIVLNESEIKKRNWHRLTWLQYPNISSSNNHSNAAHSLDRKFCEVVSVGVFPGPRGVVLLSFNSFPDFFELRLAATSVPAKHSLIECFMSFTKVVSVFDIHLDRVFRLQNICNRKSFHFISLMVSTKSFKPANFRWLEFHCHSWGHLSTLN